MISGKISSGLLPDKRPHRHMGPKLFEKYVVSAQQFRRSHIVVIKSLSIRLNRGFLAQRTWLLD